VIAPAANLMSFLFVEKARRYEGVPFGIGSLIIGRNVIFFVGVIRILIASYKASLPTMLSTSVVVPSASVIVAFAAPLKSE